MSLELVDVSKNFGGVHALRSVTLTFPDRGVVGLIGPNGSGKSTLLGLISGIIRPTAGSIFLNQVRLRGGPERFARAGVARSFQRPRLVEGLRVWENIALGARTAGNFGNAAKLRDRVGDVAAKLELLGVLGRWPSEVPSVAQRKVEIARALLADPTVLLLDEPAAGMSHGEAEELVPVIERASAGLLTVLVEHNIDLIHELSGHVIMLLEGRVASQGTPDDIRQSPEVQQAYLGQGAPRPASVSTQDES